MGFSAGAGAGLARDPRAGRLAGAVRRPARDAGCRLVPPPPDRARRDARAASRARLQRGQLSRRSLAERRAARPTRGRLSRLRAARSARAGVGRQPAGSKGDAADQRRGGVPRSSLPGNPPRQAVLVRADGRHLAGGVAGGARRRAPHRADDRQRSPHRCGDRRRRAIGRRPRPAAARRGPRRRRASRRLYRADGRAARPARRAAARLVARSPAPLRHHRRAAARRRGDRPDGAALRLPHHRDP